MTIKEFNDKYKDYLEEQHYGLSINDERVIEYLDKEFQNLIKISGFKYYQIKLKFGTCRFYVSNVVDAETIKDIEDTVTLIVNQDG